MATETLANIWSSYSFPDAVTFIKDKTFSSLFKGLAGSSDAFFICNLFLSTQQPIIVFVENSKRAEILVDECRSLISEESVLLFPSRDAVPYNLKSPFGPTVESRLNVLNQLLAGNRKIIIAPSTTLLQKIPPQRELFKKTIRLHCNDELSIDELSQWLIEIGFRRENLVSDIGMFSIRGGIIDIYPFLTEHPLRIEFWGNTIDSIRLFDVFSQKSLDHCNSITIVPMKEFCFSSLQISEALKKIKEYCNTELHDTGGFFKLEHQWNVDELEGIEWFLHWFDQQTVSILDYLSLDTFIVWDDAAPVYHHIDEATKNYQRHLDRVPSLLLPLLSTPHQLLYSYHSTKEILSCFKTIYINTIDLPKEIPVYSFAFSEQPQLPSELKALTAKLEEHQKNGYRCILICPNQGHVERMKELLDENSFSIEFLTGFLSRGYIDHQNRTSFYTESRIISRPLHIKKQKKRSPAIPLSGFDSLSPDDYVVHEEHGIARFLGIEHLLAGDLEQDCMVLLYANGTRIYVPVHDFYKVQKYIGKDSSPPQLSKIGTASWEKLKNKTRESLKEMAAELINLYAKRQYLPGIRYDPDTIWQKEFEDAFIYDETPDQLRSVKEIKEDMESSKPMDRLVCGDVGFGKTEVAMRAAFKAVMSGYQVAVLAPTTILASQHFSSFSDRMRNFPVKIVVMSRFIKTSQQKQYIEQIKTGAADIIIGTHRILSNDIVFKNLGLLIIDEEQRFGVQNKEKIKQFRFKVDVLSLTATPIPRTLQLSLIGARDLSVINTPPLNRLPIETIVCPYHEEQVKTAIENELERGGQIYFVNNRIKSLDLMKDNLEQLVPQARIITAHGQMDEELLENIMKEFIAGRYDVLLSTVIIENGLDIPNVNTIIVNRADTMGLAQLYQLRGRVGRSSEQAFSYFFTPPFKEINDTALKRLKALEQYTELGSGFQIAMRDLEIRGAGNILGTRQHGFINAVGFEMYCRILQEAINQLQGNPPPPKPLNIHLEIPLEAYIPTEYISDGPTRISLYQDLSSLTDFTLIPEIEKSLFDRFGAFPQTVVSLIILIKIKLLASLLMINKIVLTKQNMILIYFEGEYENLNKIISLFILDPKHQFKIDNTPPISINFPVISSTVIDQCLEIIELLYSVSQKLDVLISS